MKENDNKSRLLALYNVLSSMTDENNPMSMKEIQSEMQKRGNECSDDSIFRYINQLRNELGVDIISSKGRNAKYFIGSRAIDKEEMQVIIDAINASTVIDKKTTQKIIKKIKSLTSVNIAQSLERTILSAKNEAKKKRNILYRIAEIQEALDYNCQIRFEYVDWQIDKTLSSSGREYFLNPWGFIWANDRYYLYGYTVEEDDSDIQERTFRVDKIKKVEKIDRQRQGAERFKSFNVYDYVSRRIDMFSAPEEKVTLRMPYYLAGIFIDRFGEKIDIIDEGKGIIEVSFKVACSDYFLGWLLGIGNVEVVGPENVREKMIKLLESGMSIYKK